MGKKSNRRKTLWRSFSITEQNTENQMLENSDSNNCNDETKSEQETSTDSFRSKTAYNSHFEKRNSTQSNPSTNHHIPFVNNPHQSEDINNFTNKRLSYYHNRNNFKRFPETDYNYYESRNVVSQNDDPSYRTLNSPRYARSLSSTSRNSMNYNRNFDGYDRQNSFYYQNKPFYNKSRSTPQYFRHDRQGEYGERERRNSTDSSGRQNNSQPINEDDYVRISTPRQDIIFKRGYLSRPKESNSSLTNTNTYSSAASSIVSEETFFTSTNLPSPLSAEPNDSEHMVMVNYINQNGFIYVNPCVPPPSIDPYSNQMLMMPYGYMPYVIQPQENKTVLKSNTENVPPDENKSPTIDSQLENNENLENNSEQTQLEIVENCVSEVKNQEGGDTVQEKSIAFNFNGNMAVNPNKCAPLLKFENRNYPNSHYINYDANRIPLYQPVFYPYSFYGGHPTVPVYNLLPHAVPVEKDDGRSISSVDSTSEHNEHPTINGVVLDQNISTNEFSVQNSEYEVQSSGALIMNHSHQPKDLHQPKLNADVKEFIPRNITKPYLNVHVEEFIPQHLRMKETKILPKSNGATLKINPNQIDKSTKDKCELMKNQEKIYNGEINKKATNNEVNTTEKSKANCTSKSNIQNTKNTTENKKQNNSLNSDKQVKTITSSKTEKKINLTNDSKSLQNGISTNRKNSLIENTTKSKTKASKEITKSTKNNNSSAAKPSKKTENKSDKIRASTPKQQKSKASTSLSNTASYAEIVNTNITPTIIEPESITSNNSDLITEKSNSTISIITVENDDIDLKNYSIDDDQTQRQKSEESICWQTVKSKSKRTKIPKSIEYHHHEPLSNQTYEASDDKIKNVETTVESVPESPEISPHRKTDVNKKSKIKQKQKSKSKNTTQTMNKNNKNNLTEDVNYKWPTENVKENTDNSSPSHSNTCLLNNNETLLPDLNDVNLPNDNHSLPSQLNITPLVDNVEEETKDEEKMALQIFEDIEKELNLQLKCDQIEEVQEVDLNRNLMAFNKVPNFLQEDLTLGRSLDTDHKPKSKTILKEEEEMVLNVIKSLSSNNSLPISCKNDSETNLNKNVLQDSKNLIRKSSCWAAKIDTCTLNHGKTFQNFNIENKFVNNEANAASTKSEKQHEDFLKTKSFQNTSTKEEVNTDYINRCIKESLNFINEMEPVEEKIDNIEKIQLNIRENNFDCTSNNSCNKTEPTPQYINIKKNFTKDIKDENLTEFIPEHCNHQKDNTSENLNINSEPVSDSLEANENEKKFETTIMELNLNTINKAENEIKNEEEEHNNNNNINSNNMNLKEKQCDSTETKHEIKKHENFPECVEVQKLITNDNNISSDKKNLKLNFVDQIDSKLSDQLKFDMYSEVFDEKKYNVKDSCSFSKINFNDQNFVKNQKNQFFPINNFNDEIVYIFDFECQYSICRNDYYSKEDLKERTRLRSLNYQFGDHEINGEGLKNIKNCKDNVCNSFEEERFIILNFKEKSINSSQNGQSEIVDYFNSSSNSETNSNFLTDDSLPYSEYEINDENNQQSEEMSSIEKLYITSELHNIPNGIFLNESNSHEYPNNFEKIENNQNDEIMQKIKFNSINSLNDPEKFPLTYSIFKWLTQENKEKTPELVLRLPEDPILNERIKTSLFATLTADDNDSEFSDTDDDSWSNSTGNDFENEDCTTEATASRRTVDSTKIKNKKSNLITNPLKTNINSCENNDSDYNSDSQVLNVSIKNTNHLNKSDQNLWSPSSEKQSEYFWDTISQKKSKENEMVKRNKCEGLNIEETCTQNAKFISNENIDSMYSSGTSSMNELHDISQTENINYFNDNIVNNENQKNVKRRYSVGSFQPNEKNQNTELLNSNSKSDISSTKNDENKEKQSFCSIM